MAVTADENVASASSSPTAIGADVASVLAAVFRAYPLAEHPPSDLNL